MTNGWEIFWVVFTFSIYIFIAWRSRVKSTEGFYVAGKGVPAIANGMATGADWMSAASFLSMAGLISFAGYGASAYLLGWTGGFVLLALLLAPYLRKFGAFTVPDFVGDRYYSWIARLVALICAIFVSLTYISGQMSGVGIVFSRFFGISIELGVVFGSAIVFVYATLGGMKGITWTQVAQYVVMILAYVIPAIAISAQFTGNPIPQLGMGSALEPGQLGAGESGISVLEQLDMLLVDLGFASDYTSPSSAPGAMFNMVLLTLTLMAGTAGLPHVIVRFYTTKSVRGARWSAFWALFFIAILYTTAPSVASFARANLVHTMHNTAYEDAPEWFGNWEDYGLIAWADKNNDGVIQIAPGSAMETPGKVAKYVNDEEGNPQRGTHQQRLVEPESWSDGANELYVHRDIMVLANPEIAGLSKWIVGLVVAGGLAAALSTAAGLLLVISSSISHDLVKRTFKPEMSDKEELRWARGAAAGAVVIAMYFGINPPGFVAQTVALAFGLAASSFFPIIVLGIFWTRTNRAGAIAGMLTGLIFTTTYIILHTPFTPFIWWLNEPISTDYLLFGIKATGIGTIGMILNAVVTVIVSLLTAPPPEEVIENVKAIRYPKVDGKFKAADKPGSALGH